MKRNTVGGITLPGKKDDKDVMVIYPAKCCYSMAPHFSHIERLGRQMISFNFAFKVSLILFISTWVEILVLLKHSR